MPCLHRLIGLVAPLFLLAIACGGTSSTDLRPVATAAVTSAPSSSATLRALSRSDEAPSDVLEVLDFAVGGGGGCGGVPGGDLALESTGSSSEIAAEPVVQMLHTAIVCLLGSTGKTDVVIDSASGQHVALTLDLTDSEPYGIDLFIQPFLDDRAILTENGSVLHELTDSSPGLPNYVITATSAGQSARMELPVVEATDPVLSAVGITTFQGHVLVDIGDPVVLQGSGLDPGRTQRIALYRPASSASSPRYEFATLVEVDTDRNGELRLDLGMATEEVRGCYIARIPPTVDVDPSEAGWALPAGPLTNFCVDGPEAGASRPTTSGGPATGI